jgi:hypothetical protein
LKDMVSPMMIVTFGIKSGLGSPLSAKGAPHTSLGQRPRKAVTHSSQALKGRARGLRFMAVRFVRGANWAAPSGLCAFVDAIPRALPFGPRALPWADVGRAVGAFVFGAQPVDIVVRTLGGQNIRPDGANHASLGQRPGSPCHTLSKALKGRPNA